MKSWFRVALFLVLAFTASVSMTGCQVSVLIEKLGNLIGKGPTVSQPGTTASAPTDPATGTTPGNTVSEPPANTGDKACTVTVYGTSTCGWCTKAKDYLKSKGVLFVDKNVGTDAAAKQEMADKAKAKGLQVSGVPVIDICGDMVMGFSQAKIDELLAKHGLVGDTKPPATAVDKPAAGACKVVVYGTSSCSWCTKAKSYLKSKCVTFEDKDVGRDTAAQQEMVKKAQSAGIQPGGVPFIDICGDMVKGFDQGKIDQLLQKHGYTGCPTGNTPSDNPAE